MLQNWKHDKIIDDPSWQALFTHFWQLYASANWQEMKHIYSSRCGRQKVVGAYQQKTEMHGRGDVRGQQNKWLAYT
jgi:hypothetical protein